LPLAAGVAAVAAIAIALAFQLTPAERGLVAELAARGHKGNPRQLLTQCKSALARGDVPEAKYLAERLSKIKSTAAPARAALVAACLHAKEFNAAREAFASARDAPGGDDALREARGEILGEARRALASGEPSRDMVALAAQFPPVYGSAILRNWTRQPEYWLRWNAVAVLNTAGIKVDLVPVYVLDLQLGGSVFTRAKAAEKLGDLGDRRAVKPLQAAAALGLRDPIVSATASSALRKPFR
jgi:hypothetical protein